MSVIKSIKMQEAAKELGIKLGKAQHEEAIKLTYDACLRSVREFTQISPVDTGLYASSWAVQKQDDKKQVSFGNTAPYAHSIEVGASPHKPDIEPLLEWAARKLSKSKTSPEVMGLAYGVQRKIEKHGQKPLNILENGIKDILMPAISKELNKL